MSSEQKKKTVGGIAIIGPFVEPEKLETAVCETLEEMANKHLFVLNVQVFVYKEELGANILYMESRK